MKSDAAREKKVGKERKEGKKSFSSSNFDFLLLFSAIAGEGGFFLLPPFEERQVGKKWNGEDFAFLPPKKIIYRYTT